MAKMYQITAPKSICKSDPNFSILRPAFKGEAFSGRMVEFEE